MTSTELVDVEVTVNGELVRHAVPPRLSAAEFIRTYLGLTGTHVGCEQGSCGVCTVLLEGASVRSCLIFAVQLHGRDVLTVEGLAGSDGECHPIQRAFRDCHGLQCGFCTPGMLMTSYELLLNESNLSTETIRGALSGNLCRCTGYHGIVQAVQQADREWSR